MLKKTLTLGLLLLSLFALGCTEEQISDEVPNETEVTIGTDKVIEPEVELVQEILECTDRVQALEIPIDRLIELYNANMSSVQAKKSIDNFVFGPNIITFVGLEDYSPVRPIRALDAKGLTIDDFISAFKPIIDRHIDHYYGDVTYGEIELSQLFDDGYFKYLFTRQTLTTEKFLEGLNVNSTRYVKYTFVEKEGVPQIFEVDHYLDHEYWRELNSDDAAMTNRYKEMEEKFTRFKDNEIWED